jgi:hypothetical protein
MKKLGAQGGEATDTGERGARREQPAGRQILYTARCGAVLGTT